MDLGLVDEGFGSLDDASREIAVKVLTGNSGLVGIISHVNERKEQTDVRLNVIRTEEGSRIS